MNNPLHIQAFLDNQVPTLLVVDESLNELIGDSCLQFPTLLIAVAAKLNWGSKQLRENDPIIRKYIRNHPDWHVTRGAGGGIMKASDKQSKDALVAAKKKAREEMNAVLEAKMAQLQNIAPAIVNDEIINIENDIES